MGENGPKIGFGVVFHIFAISRPFCTFSAFGLFSILCQATSLANTEVSAGAANTSGRLNALSGSVCCETTLAILLYPTIWGFGRHSVKRLGAIPLLLACELEVRYPFEKGVHSATCVIPHESKEKRVPYPVCDTISKSHCLTRSRVDRTWAIAKRVFCESSQAKTSDLNLRREIA